MRAEVREIQQGTIKVPCEHEGCNGEVRLTVTQAANTSTSEEPELGRVCKD